MNLPSRPLPDIDHPVHAPFWRAAATGSLAVQHCAVCGHRRWPPAPLCPECLSPGGEWAAVDGGGVVWSLAVYEHAYLPAFAADVPYTCALIDLDAGPRMIGRVESDGPIEVGARVRVRFKNLGSGVCLPYFEPEPQTGADR